MRCTAACKKGGRFREFSRGASGATDGSDRAFSPPMVFSNLFTKRVWLVFAGIVFLGNGDIAGAAEVAAGKSVTLTVTADGTAPFSYRWLKDGVEIAGAVSASHTIGKFHASDVGGYVAIVSNRSGSATSLVVSLQVQTLTATQAPENAPGSSTPSGLPVPSQLSPAPEQSYAQIAMVGHEVAFAAAGVDGTGQWQVSADGISWNNLGEGAGYGGTTTSTLTHSNVGEALHGNRYRFRTATATSAIITLVVSPVLFPYPGGIAADGAGNLYVTDASTDTVRKISSAGISTLLAGSSGQTGVIDGMGANARFNDPSGLVASPDGTLYLCDSANGIVRRINADGSVGTFAGSATNRGNGDGSGAGATFSSPLGIGRDGAGNLYVADALNNTVRKITASGFVSTLAGSAGQAGSADGLGGTARFNHPTGIALDDAGNVYVADTTNNTIRKITAGGVVTTLAGLTGVSGTDDGVGSGASFNRPGGLAVDGAGSVYVADTGNSCIRKISSNGRVSTLAGLPGVAGLMDGAGTNAWFNQPKGLALDAAGNLYVADTGNAAIRRVASNGSVATLALARGDVATDAPGAEIKNPAPSPAPNTSVTGSQSAASGPAGSGGGGGGGGSIGWGLAGGLLAICFGRWGPRVCSERGRVHRGPRKI